MKTARTPEPLIGNKTFLTDGGLETSLIFEQGYELPYFAAFTLLRDKSGRTALRQYYEKYAAIAIQARSGFILESPTWRANRDWATKLGIDGTELRRLNQSAIGLLESIRQNFALPESPFLISGCIGPRGDGYVAGTRMTIGEARDYHSEQILSFAATHADLVCAMTLSYPEEAIGIVLAAQEQGIPVVISFTTETDGCLPCGQTLRDAIETTDRETGNGPLYYMVNCAHPDHFRDALEANEKWVKRVQGVRANASRKSHAELDESEKLDSGNPQELGSLYRQLVHTYPHFRVLGGCCGTNHAHIGEISTCCHRH